MEFVQSGEAGKVCTVTKDDPLNLDTALEADPFSGAEPVDIWITTEPANSLFSARLI